MKEPRTESDLWKQLKPEFKKIDVNSHVIRMGSDTNLGIPDIYYSIKYNDEILTGFIELKMGKFMKRTKVLKINFSTAQLKWKESRSGSVTSVFIYYAGYILRPEKWKREYTLFDVEVMNKIIWRNSGNNPLINLLKF